MRSAAAAASGSPVRQRYSRSAAAADAAVVGDDGGTDRAGQPLGAGTQLVGVGVQRPGHRRGGAGDGGL